MKKYFATSVSIENDDTYLPEQSGQVDIPQMVQSPVGGKIIHIGKFLVFKRGMTTPDGIEPTDIVEGIIGYIEFMGIFLGGNMLDLESYDILEQKDMSIPSVITLVFDDINVSMSTIGIDDKTSIDDWNTLLESKNFTYFPFDSVEIDGNSAMLTRNNPNALSYDMAGMTISSIDLFGFNALQVLILNNNALSDSINNTLFPISLLNLGIDYNNITTFNPIYPLPNALTTLTLNGNQLTEFNPDIQLPDTLLDLSISINNLDVFDPIHPLPSNLQSLGVQSNNLTEFDPSLVLPHNLQVLDLGGNIISVFNPTLPLPVSLSVLSLRGNLLNEFDPSQSNLTSLTVLNLESNNIDTFDPSTVGLSNISILALNSNKLVLFNPTSPLTSLSNLGLGNNLITTSSWNNETEWINNIPNNGYIYSASNTNTINGTNTNTLLSAKNWTI
jgi:hypothetical protein